MTRARDPVAAAFEDVVDEVVTPEAADNAEKPGTNERFPSGCLTLRSIFWGWKRTKYWDYYPRF